jgi:AcrR family transcriptional regulator
VLRAAVELIERDGYGRLTIEGIARTAGVSKQTIYRWWSTKAAIVLEALNDAASAIAPLPRTGDLRTDVQVMLRATVAGAGGRNGRLLAALMAEAQLNRTFAEPFLTQFLARRRGVLRELLERGRASGEIPPSADLDLAVDLVYGSLWYRILTRHAPLDQSFADGLADALMAATAVSGAAPPARAGVE